MDVGTPSILLAIAEAHDAAARTLRRQAARLDDRPHQAVAAAAPFDSAVEAVRSIHPQVGSRQEEVIDLLEEAGRDGLSTGTLSRRMGYDQPNVYLTLQALVRHGFVERDASVSPHIYRLSDDLSPKQARDSA